jgi:hypothetical protein
MGADRNEFSWECFSFPAHELHQPTQTNKVSIRVAQVGVITIKRRQMEEAAVVIILEGQV